MQVVVLLELADQRLVWPVLAVRLAALLARS